MAGQQPRGWQEQLGEVRDKVPSSDEETTDAHATEESHVMADVRPFPPSKPAASAGVPSGAPTPDDVNVSQGKLHVKTGVGEATISLSKETEAQFVQQAMKYQRAIINEKRVNTFSIAATAVLSALSALAIGVTLCQGLRGKKTVTVLDV